jgi:hypothetical protein
VPLDRARCADERSVFWLCDLDLLMGFYALVRQVQRTARRRGYDTRRVVGVGGVGPAAQTILAAIDAHGPPDVLATKRANRAS